MAQQSEYERKLHTQAKTTFLLSGLWLLVLVVFVSHGIYKYNQLTDEEKLVDQAVEAIKKDYPEFRKQLVSDIQTSAPKYAEHLSQSLIKAAPDVRQEAEQFVTRQIDTGSDELIALSSEKFNEYVANNREMFEKWLTQLDESPEKVKQLSQEMNQQIEELVGTDLQKQLDMLLAAHEKLNERLGRIEKHAGLSPTELIERRIVRILKALEQKYVTENDGEEVASS